MGELGAIFIEILVLTGCNFQRELVDNIHKCKDCEIRNLGIICAMQDVSKGLKYVLKRDFYIFFRFLVLFGSFILRGSCFCVKDGYIHFFEDFWGN
jgi:hypothetical protein